MTVNTTIPHQNRSPANADAPTIVVGPGPADAKAASGFYAPLSASQRDALAASALNSGSLNPFNHSYD